MAIKPMAGSTQGGQGEAAHSALGTYATSEPSGRRSLKEWDRTSIELQTQHNGSSDMGITHTQQLAIKQGK